MTTESQQHSLSDMVDQARGMIALNPMIAPHLEQFWKAQDSLLAEAESFASAWFLRRHRATQTALDAVRKLNGNGTDSAEMAQAIMDWQQGSLQRLTDDMQQWLEMFSRCANCVANAEAEAETSGTRETTKRAKSMSRTEHATPL